MAGNKLLDTNIVIAILNQEAIFAEHLKGIGLFVSSTVLGELYYGAFKSARPAANLKRIEDFLMGYQIISNDKVTAEIYGQIKTRLEAKGRLIPENDIWIAATAIQHDLTLVTRDDHFQAVDNLNLEKW